MKMSWLSVLAGAVLAYLVMASPGCSTLSREDAQAMRDDTAAGIEEGTALRGTLALELAETRVRLDAAIAEADEARAEAERKNAELLETSIARVDSFLEPASASLEVWDTALATWDSQGDGAALIQTIGSKVLPFLPVEFQAPGLLVVSIGGAVWRLMQRSKSLNSLARSTVVLADKVPAVKDAISANADMLRVLQSTGAKAAVDAAQGKKLALPV